MVGRAPLGMGNSPKSETRCHKFSFFGRQDFQKRDFRKSIKCGGAFQMLGKCPYQMALARLYSALLKCVVSIP
jgi:hypothetical protein